jgi:hypothetical protein
LVRNQGTVALELAERVGAPRGALHRTERSSAQVIRAALSRRPASAAPQ